MVHGLRILYRCMFLVLVMSVLLGVLENLNAILKMILSPITVQRHNLQGTFRDGLCRQEVKFWKQCYTKQEASEVAVIVLGWVTSSAAVLNTLHFVKTDQSKDGCSNFALYCSYKCMYNFRGDLICLIFLNFEQVS